MEVLVEHGRTTGMIYMMLIGANVLSYFVTARAHARGSLWRHQAS